ncbi:DUF262 domain-containing protein [Mycoplasma marinum]|uniref:DUF262 domain-containing protein n=1 Tax=Mycoplasma marinum TaxID=1937190 RepID=UPI003B32D37C
MQKNKKIHIANVYEELLEPTLLQFVIPIYQRKYVWKIENIKKLVSDILFSYRETKKVKGEKQEYFIGSMVFKKTANSYQHSFTIVDGQQRITTLFMICKVMNEIHEDIMKDIYFSPGKDIRIQSNNKKYDDMLKVIFDYGNNVIVSKEFTMAVKTFEDIRKWMNKEFDREQFIELKEAIKNLYISQINLREYEDESDFFESINSTGEKLETWDLFKNFVFKDIHNLEIFTREKIKNNESIFEEIIEQNIISNFTPGEDDGQIKKEKNDFLRYFLDHKFNVGLVKKGYPVYFEIKKLLIKQNGNKWSSETLGAFLKEMSEISEIWKTFKTIPNIGVKSKDNREHFYKKVISKQNQFFPMYLQMHLKYIKNSCEYSENKYKEMKIAKFITFYKLSRESIGRGSKNLTRSISSFFKNFIEKHPGGSITDFAKYTFAELNENQRTPNKFEVLSKMRDLDYNKDKEAIKNILIASELNSNKNEVLDLGLNIEIEHIFPQNPSSGWHLEYGSDDMEKFALNRNKFLNLTVLSDGANKYVSNWTYDKKREYFIRNDKFSINKIFLDFPKYNKEMLEARYLLIVEQFLGLFNEFFQDEDLVIAKVSKTPKSSSESKVQKWVEEGVVEWNSLKSNYNHKIFEYAEKCESVPKVKMRVFTKEYATWALRRYLLEGISGQRNEAGLTNGDIKNGFIQKSTFNMIGIKLKNSQTKKIIGKEREKLISLIEEYVKECYG